MFDFLKAHSLLNVHTHLRSTIMLSMKANLLFLYTVYCLQCIGLAHKFADRVIVFPGHIHPFDRAGDSLCHWAPSRVQGDDGACSFYDGIILPVNCCYVAYIKGISCTYFF